MFSVGKVRFGRERYYLATIARPGEAAQGLIEPDPLFLGSGSRALGLAGRASREEVSALMAHRQPAGGLPFPARGRARLEIAAYDLTFSAPKSVSLLQALAPPAAADQLRAAHEQAVASALSFIESELLELRASERTRPEAGAVAVSFLHRTSRAADPHLHSHVLLLNIGQRQDGSYCALDARPLFAAQRLVRALYDSELRARLTAGGMEFAPPTRGFADLVSVPPTALREFSRQGALVQAALAAAGPLGPGERDRLTELLRPAKDLSRSYEELVAEWRERAYETGLSPGRLARAVPPTAPPPRPRPPLDPGHWLEGASRDPSGSVSRHELLFARAAADRQGALIRQVVAEVDGLVAAGGLERCGDRFVAPGAAERLRRAGEGLAALAAGVELRLLAYEPGGRLAALDRLAHLGAEGRVVALAPGRQAAEALSASTGLECRRPLQAASELGPLDWVVAADCASFSPRELEEAISLASAGGAGLVLFASREKLASSHLLAGLVGRGRSLPPRRAGPEVAEPDLEVAATVVEAVARPSLACARAANLALAEAARGAPTLVLVPEPCLRRAVGRLLEEGDAGRLARVGLAGRAEPRPGESVVSIGRLTRRKGLEANVRSLLILPRPGAERGLEGRGDPPGRLLGARAGPAEPRWNRSR